MYKKLVLLMHSTIYIVWYKEYIYRYNVQGERKMSINERVIPFWIS